MAQYPSYKDSGFDWIGQIPSHWGLLKSKFLWRESFNTSATGTEDLLSVSQYDGVTPANGSRSESLVGYKVVEENNLVINIMLAWMGGLGVSAYNGLVSPAYCVYKLQGDNNPKYMHYLYKTPMYLAEFARHSTGVIPSRWRMYTDDFGQVLTLIPPRKEQDAMVEYLDAATAKIDEAIAQQQRMIDLLNEREQVIIDKAALGGLNSAVELQDSGNDWIGLIPKHWRINKFRYLFKTRTGITFTKTQLEDEGEPVISYGQIHSKDNWGASVNPELIRHIPSELTKGKEGALAMPGDFLFADTSEDFEGCGNNIFIDSKPVYAGYHTILARNNHQEYGPYLAYLFTSTRWRGQVRSMVNGVKVYSITQGILNSANVILPPKEEQKVIADYITTRVIKLDEGVRRHKEYIKVLQERKQIIINDVVTGKVKVV